MPKRHRGLLYPLDHFYELERLFDPPGPPLPKVQEIAGEEMPQPYRHLLVGTHDMTPTLEEFHGDRVDLEVQGWHRKGERFAREVVLRVRGTGRAVEFGSIIIYLDRFPHDARQAILDGHLPLGTILARYNIAHHGCPQAFLKVQSDDVINNALSLEGSHTLYGRRNWLLNEKEEVLADICEILPPEGPQHLPAEGTSN
jgi:chorismate-pyruvate lyase